MVIHPMASRPSVVAPATSAANVDGRVARLGVVVALVVIASPR
jgi:hypothetical protein